MLGRGDGQQAVAVGVAGEHDDLAPGGSASQDRGDAAQSLPVGVAERIVEHEGDAGLVGHQLRRRQTDAEGQLLEGPRGQPLEGKRDPL